MGCCCSKSLFSTQGADKARKQERCEKANQERNVLRQKIADATERRLQLMESRGLSAKKVEELRASRNR